jgi:hypothetical protein
MLVLGELNARHGLVLKEGFDISHRFFNSDSSLSSVPKEYSEISFCVARAQDLNPCKSFEKSSNIF